MVTSFRRLGPLLVVAAAAAAFASAGGASAGGGGCHNSEVTEGSGSEVSIDAENCFGPMVLHAEPGTAVTFSNESGATHNIAGHLWGTFQTNDGQLPDGETFAMSFSDPGYYPFACTLHFNMVGLVIVGGPAAETPSTTAVAESDAGGSIGGRTWALIAAGALAVGMVGGGAFLRLHRRSAAVPGA